jgi:hypothetical protein
MPDISSIIADLERQKSAIDNALAALRGIGGQPAAKKRGRPKCTKDRGSVDGRQRQADSMRKYWAARKALSKRTKKAAKKTGLTAAGRKALSENMKRMWAEKRLGKKTKGR